MKKVVAKEIKKELSPLERPGVERNILAICLQKPEKLVDLRGLEVTADMFLIEANKYIFYTISYLFDKRQDPTPITVMETIKNEKYRKVVEEWGGEEYIGMLMEVRVSDNSLEILAEKLKQAYTRKSLIDICEESREFLLSDETNVLNPTELIASIDSRLADLSTTVQQTKEIYKMGDDAEEVLKLRAEAPDSIPGLEVGFPKFDYYTNGGQPGDLIMVCARAKTGKSTLLTNWATKLGIIDRIPVLYFDTEMNSREQEDRILSILSGVPHKEIVSGMYMLDTENGKSEDKIKSLKHAISLLKNGNYYHIYMPNFSIDKVNAVAKKFKLQHNIQAIFFDYLKFPASSVGALKNAQEWQMLGFIASGLKDLAGTMNIPIYSACQENRSDPKSDKKSELNVGGSDRILQLASKLIFLYNKSEEEIMRMGDINGNQNLYIAYQRNGESDVAPISIFFDKGRLTQREV